MTRKTLLSLIAALLVFASLAGSALASDHLFDAAISPGAAVREFSNPVVGNPSDAAVVSSPGTVPGEGNPFSGQDTGTPAVDLSLASARSGGNANPTGPQ